MKKSKGTPCAICGKTKYGKSLKLIDKYRFKDGREIFSFDTPYGSHYACKDCLAKFEVVLYNNERAWMAVEK